MYNSTNNEVKEEEATFVIQLFTQKQQLISNYRMKGVVAAVLAAYVVVAVTLMFPASNAVLEQAHTHTHTYYAHTYLWSSGAMRV